jgi:uncharacterized protein YihD (DUF1040 family)
MREPKRIDIVLSEIREIWQQNPDLRLGQLLCNVLRDPMLYYVEDEQLVEYVKKYYNTTE